MTAPHTPAVAGEHARRRRLRRSGAIVAVMVAAGAAFLLPGIGSADKGEKEAPKEETISCEQLVEDAEAADVKVEELDRDDFTPGEMGGIQYKAEQATLQFDAAELERQANECLEEEAKSEDEEDDESDSEDDGTTTTTEDDSSSEGTPDDPHVGTERNTNPIFGEVQNWTDLTGAADNFQVYWEDAARWPGIQRSEATAAVAKEQQGSNFNALVVAGCRGGVSEAEARQMAADHDVADAASLPIFFHEDGIWNSRLNDGHVTPFWDDDCQVRLTLLTPADYAAFVDKGVVPTKGALGMCGNLWSTEGPPAPPATPVTPTQPPPTPTTQPPATTAPPPVTTTRPPATTTAPPPTTNPPTTTTTKGPQPLTYCELYPTMPGC